MSMTFEPVCFVMSPSYACWCEFMVNFVSRFSILCYSHRYSHELQSGIDLCYLQFAYDPMMPCVALWSLLTFQPVKRLYRVVPFRKVVLPLWTCQVQGTQNWRAIMWIFLLRSGHGLRQGHVLCGLIPAYSSLVLALLFGGFLNVCFGFFCLWSLLLALFSCVTLWLVWVDCYGYHSLNVPILSQRPNKNGHIGAVSKTQQLSGCTEPNEMRHCHKCVQVNVTLIISLKTPQLSDRERFWTPFISKSDNGWMDGCLFSRNRNGVKLASFTLNKK